MYNPKFKIGDIVKSDRYEFKNALIIGFKVYPEGKWREDFKDLQEFLNESNNADYELICNEGGVTFYDCFSEEHLILQKERDSNEQRQNIRTRD